MSERFGNKFHSQGPARIREDTYYGADTASDRMCGASKTRYACGARFNRQAGQVVCSLGQVIQPRT